MFERIQTLPSAQLTESSASGEYNHVMLGIILVVRVATIQLKRPYNFEIQNKTRHFSCFRDLLIIFIVDTHHRQRKLFISRDHIPDNHILPLLHGTGLLGAVADDE